MRIMAHEEKNGTIEVEVAYATPARQLLLRLSVPAGSTLGDAIDRSGIRDEWPEIEVDPARVGVFGRKKPLDTVLREGDRVEIYRPLIADPIEARRRRARDADDRQN
jgi:hypothetical protein